MAAQKPLWCVEVKWSDLPASDKRMFKGLVEYSIKNHLDNALVTTRTLTEEKEISGVSIRFRPSAAYAYTLGTNILNEGVMLPCQGYTGG